VDMDDARSDDSSSTKSAHKGSPSAEPPITKVCSGDLCMGKIFRDIHEAKDVIQGFARCPVKKSSTHEGKYVQFLCFRAGSYKKKESKVSSEFQRKCSSMKCDCSFSVCLNELANQATRFTKSTMSIIISFSQMKRLRCCLKT